MKMRPLLIFCLLSFLMSCGADSTSDNTTQDSAAPAETQPTKEAEVEIPKVEEKPDNRIPLKLDGIYATSTADNSDVRFIFDRDDASVWKTRKGAGPDEGVMLYFADPTFIKSIQVETLNGSGFTKVSAIGGYGNGAPLDLEQPMGGDINQELLSLYIRFYTKNDITITSQNISSDFYKKINIHRTASDSQIAVSKIIIEGKDGAYKIIPPDIFKGDVNASSTLNEASFAYDPSLLFDARKEFVWVEGAKGNGEGEILTFDFDKEVTIAGLKIWNGYQRSESHFKSNAQLKSFSFGKKGEENATYQLKSEQGAQVVKLEKPLKGKRFELVIDAAFKGWSYKDMAISELLFFDEGDALFGIQSPKTAANRNTIIERSKGTILEELLDSRVYNDYEGTDEYEVMSLERSAILRSDGTFVLYDQESDDVDVMQTIADGNWEIIKADEKAATIKVFGKFLDFSLLEQYYAGQTDAELSRIFKDNITIQNNVIRGQKLINAIQF